jgi:hypothetical protein
VTKTPDSIRAEQIDRLVSTPQDDRVPIESDGGRDGSFGPEVPDRFPGGLAQSEKVTRLGAYVNPLPVHGDRAGDLVRDFGFPAGFPLLVETGHDVVLVQDEELLWTESGRADERRWIGLVPRYLLRRAVQAVQMAPVGREIEAAALPFGQGAVEPPLIRYLAGLFQGKDDAVRVGLDPRPEERTRK